MPKGGARTRSGPAPDPNALRRDRDSSEWLTLPAAGRAGDPPDWPLSPKALKREAAIWEQLWSLPQAVAWESQRQHLEVALYVRRLAEAEKRDSPTNLSTLVRQMADSLGLTTPGLRSNRWRIEVVAEKAATRRSASSARERFTVVAGGGA